MLIYQFEYSIASMADKKANHSKSDKDVATCHHTDRSSSGEFTGVLNNRRHIIKVSAAIISGAALNLTATEAQSDTTSLPNPKAKLRPQAGDRIQVVKGPLKNQFIKTDSLEVNAIGVEGFPFDPVEEILRRKNRLNRLLIIRLNPDEMDEPTRENSVDGLLAYSALCTHRNCTIQSWMEEQRHLRCHCHLSEFAALSEGSVKGGPARKRLPMLPLGTDEEGYIIALDSFTRKPGGAKL